MNRFKLHPYVVLGVFSLITAYLLIQHVAWAGFVSANTVIVPMGIFSAILAWFMSIMHDGPSWKRGLIMGFLAALLGTILMTGFVSFHRSGGQLNSTFGSEWIIGTIVAFTLNGLKFPLPMMAIGAVAGFLSNNYIQFQEASK